MEGGKCWGKQMMAEVKSIEGWLVERHTNKKKIKVGIGFGLCVVFRF